MKTRITLLLAAMMLSIGSMFAQKTVTVEANSEDISDHLDLKAIGIMFGKAKNLEHFESMINDWENPISNLDLNYDGEVDYLRVLEEPDGDNHIVIIQAVLAKDIFQDVATLIVGKEKNKVVVQIVGDPYIYGANYVVEPVYIYTPVIYSWFWGPTYVRWYSPYYWGYYPVYYRPYYCMDYYDYHYHLRGYYRDYHYVSYRYVSEPRYRYNESRAYSEMSRRDYNTRYPERSFSNRNATRSSTISNRRDIENTRLAERSRTGATRNSESMRRSSTDAGRRGISNERGVSDSRTRSEGIGRDGRSSIGTSTTRSNSERTITTRGSSSERTSRGGESGTVRGSSSDDNRRSTPSSRVEGSSSSSSRGSSSGTVRSSSSSSSRGSSSGTVRSSSSSDNRRSAPSSSSRVGSSSSGSSRGSSSSSVGSSSSSRGSSSSSSSGSSSRGSSSRGSSSRTGR